MKLGFFSPLLSLSTGGIQNTSYLFVDAFSQFCDFKCFIANDSERIDGKQNNLIVSHFMRHQTVLLNVDLFFKCLIENRKSKFDFTFAVLNVCGVPCFLLKKIAKVPYGIMIHGNELMDEPKRDSTLGNIFITIKNKLKRVVIENADVIFANSEYTKQMCEDTYKCKRVEVIHPPIKYVDKGVKSSDKYNYVLLSIGRLVERKGFQYVVEAMPKLLSVFPYLKYYIAGDGPYRDKLNELINENNLTNSVFLLGRISEEQKEEFYNLCDIFIMPSFEIKDRAEVEGFGIVYIEANMYGKFVVATKSGGIPDAIIENKTGIFVKEKDSQSIVNALVRLYSNDFGYSKNECIEWAKKNDIKEIANQYYKNFEEIISQGYVTK